MLKQLMLVVSVSVLLGSLAVAQEAKARPVLRVGVTSGPHAQILEVVAKVAAAKGVTIEPVEFSDYVRPNAALADGSLDANSFQHRPYLDQQVADRGYRFEVAATTVTFPIAAYSTRLKSLDALPKGATLAIPNDPSNGARALKLLERAAFIEKTFHTAVIPAW